MKHLLFNQYEETWKNVDVLNRGFSNTETLCSEYKYYCEQCRSKQEAQKRWVTTAFYFSRADRTFFFYFEK